jgi:N-acetyl-alpha-D-muramate 1-phosphate uridylyltransferase
MRDSLAAGVLAAGAGTRLRPLTRLRPKALCPVDNVPLVDRAVVRAARATTDIAVNVHHGRAQMEGHLAGRVHLSLEEPEALGTAGALGQLRPWIDGRGVVVLNADAWLSDDGPLDELVSGWDGERVRLLVVDDPRHADFAGQWRYAGAAMVPWATVATLDAVPTGLYEVSWRKELAAGRLDLCPAPDPVAFRDCGSPTGYLDANLLSSGGASVIGKGAVVEGEVTESVVWPGALVGPEEHLRRAIRAGERTTVLVR